MAGEKIEGSSRASLSADAASASPAARQAPPAHDCRTCGGTGEDVYGQRCVCTYNKDRARVGAARVHAETEDDDSRDEPDQGLDFIWSSQPFSKGSEAGQ